MRARQTGHTAQLLPPLQFIMNFLRTEFELQIAFTEMYVWFTVGGVAWCPAWRRAPSGAYCPWDGISSKKFLKK